MESSNGASRMGSNPGWICRGSLLGYLGGTLTRLHPHWIWCWTLDIPLPNSYHTLRGGGGIQPISHNVFEREQRKVTSLCEKASFIRSSIHLKICHKAVCGKHCSSTEVTANPIDRTHGPHRAYLLWRSVNIRYTHVREAGGER